MWPTGFQKSSSELREYESHPGQISGKPEIAPLPALAFEFAHGGLYELLGAVDLVEHGLQIERGFGGVAAGDAVDAVLADEDERIGEHVEGDSEAATLGPEHELVLL